MVWAKTYPLSSTIGSGSTEQIRDNWEALEDWWDVNHSTFTSASSGHHTAGSVGVLLSASTATIEAVPTPGTGAIAYDTTIGQLVRYNGTAWIPFTSPSYSRVRKFLLGSQSVPATAWTILQTTATLSAGEYDTLSEFSTSTWKFTVKNTGYYLVRGSLRFNASTGCLMGIGIKKNGTTDLATALEYVTYPWTRTIDLMDIQFLYTSDYITMIGYHNYTTSLTVYEGYFEIMRLS